MWKGKVDTGTNQMKNLVINKKNKLIQKWKRRGEEIGKQDQCQNFDRDNPRDPDKFKNGVLN
jgi:hypothetical protein